MLLVLHSLWISYIFLCLSVAGRPRDGVDHHNSAAVSKRAASHLVRRNDLTAHTEATIKSPLVWPIKLDHMPPQIHRDAKRVRLYYGPYQIFGQMEPKGNVSRGMNGEGVTIDHSVAGFCTNCTVLSAKTDTYYLNGTRATIETGIYDHHILILDPSKLNALPWWLCEGQKGLGDTKSAGFMVTGVDEAPNLYTVKDWKLLSARVQSGYYISEAQRKFSLSAELINYWDTAQEVYITAETEFIEGKQIGWRDASMSLMSVTGCKSPGYKAPNGTKRFEMTSDPFTFPKSGTIISGKGHLHDGGESISLNVNNETMCNSVARYGGIGSNAVDPDGNLWQTIHEMSTCTDKIEVKRGDKLTVRTVYDVEKHRLRRTASGHGDGEGMGTFFINFAAMA